MAIIDICMKRAQKYENSYEQIKALCAGEEFDIARYASIACILAHEFEDFFWTGFYIIDPKKPDELVIGPYQGTLACLRIPFGRGVCGMAAQKGKTIIVDNVHEFDGHIACDSATNSEIVVPVFDKAGKLQAVLDIDSTKFANFNDLDQYWLEKICKTIFSQ